MKRSPPAFKTKHGSVNLEAWGPPKQSRLVDWFRLQVHLFRWQKSATDPSRSAWDKEYRLRMKDVPDLFKCWDEFGAFFETWASDSPVRWRPEFIREIPTEISAAPGAKRPFYSLSGGTLLEVIEANARTAVQDEWHTYLYLRRLEQDKETPTRWELDHRILAVDVEDLHAGFCEFDRWYRGWVRPCTTRAIWQGEARKLVG